jgi:hypothetical protein
MFIFGMPLNLYSSPWNADPGGVKFPVYLQTPFVTRNSSIYAFAQFAPLPLKKPDPITSHLSVPVQVVFVPTTTPFLKALVIVPILAYARCCQELAVIPAERLLKTLENPSYKESLPAVPLSFNLKICVFDVLVEPASIISAEVFGYTKVSSVKSPFSHNSVTGVVLMCEFVVKYPEEPPNFD